MATVQRMNLLAAKVESTVGTAVSTAAVDSQFHVFNTNVQTNIDFVTRQLNGSLSNLTSVHGPRSVVITFSIYMTGNGSAGIPAYATLFLEACGLKETTASFKFNPSSFQDDHTSLSMAIYKDGTVTKARGCRGNVDFVFEHGRPIRLDFTFTGVEDGVSDVSSPTGQTWSTLVPPRVASGTFTLGSFTPVLSTFNIGTNNDVQLRPTIANDEAYISSIIVNRNFSGQADPEMELVATNNYFLQLKNHTEQALSISVGTVQYNKILITAPKLQWNTLQESSRQGLNSLTASFSLNADLSVGIDTELEISFPQT